jgi:hypothetical protein
MRERERDGRKGLVATGRGSSWGSDALCTTAGSQVPVLCQFATWSRAVHRARTAFCTSVRSMSTPTTDAHRKREQARSVTSPALQPMSTCASREEVEN